MTCRVKAIHTPRAARRWQPPSCELGSIDVTAGPLVGADGLDRRLAGWRRPASQIFLEPPMRRYQRSDRYRERQAMLMVSSFRPLSLTR
jgi:hypothetical protein